MTHDTNEPLTATDARLAALEQLSALDQELELEYGLADNPLAKARTPADAVALLPVPEPEPV